MLIERLLEKSCLYPLCSVNVPSARADIERDDLLRKRKLYCSKRCYALSKFYASQLSDEPFHLRVFSKGVLVFPPDHGSSSGSKGDKNDLLVGFVKQRLAELQLRVDNDSVIIRENESTQTTPSPPCEESQELEEDYALEDISRMPTLSSFGRIWSRLSQLVTRETRSFLEGPSESVLASNIAADDEVSVERRDIFSQRVLKTLSLYHSVSRRIDYRDDLVCSCKLIFMPRCILSELLIRIS